MPVPAPVITPHQTALTNDHRPGIARLSLRCYGGSMDRTAAERMRRYRARIREAKGETRTRRCWYCREEFTASRTDATTCGPTCRSKLRHYRRRQAAALAEKRGITDPVAIKLLGEAFPIREARPEHVTADLILSPQGLPAVALRDAFRLALAVADGRPVRTDRTRSATLHTTHQWLLKHRDQIDPKALRGAYKAVTGRTLRKGPLKYGTIGISDHAHRVMRAPERRQMQSVREASGDCVVVATAILLRISYRAAVGLLGHCGPLTPLQWKQELKTAGYRVIPCRVSPGTTLANAADRLTDGRYMLFTDGHAAALVDGRVDDHAAGTTRRVHVIYQVER